MIDIMHHTGFIRIALALAAVALTAVGGVAVCKAAGHDPHLTQMAIAGAIAIVASGLGLVPIALVRGEQQIAVVQACLIGSVVHMLATLLLAGAEILWAAGTSQPFLIWLLAFYWTSLAALVIAFIGAIKAVPSRGAITPATNLG